MWGFKLMPFHCKTIWYSLVFVLLFQILTWLSPGIKIPENCVARVREELLQMDEEVKRRRKEREQQAVEQRLAEERARMEQNKHLLPNLVSQEQMLQLVQSHSHGQILRQKLSQNALQQTQTGSLSQLQRIQTQAALQQPSQNMLPLPSIQLQQRTHKNWPDTSTSTSTTNNIASLPPFYPPSFLSSFAQLNNPSLPLHNTTPSPSMSKNTLEGILDLTVCSPSPSPDPTENGLNLNSLARNPVTFDLESLFTDLSQSSSNVQQQEQQQPTLQVPQQQNHSMLANNCQDLTEYFDFPLSPQMSTQKASPSSSTSSGSSSTSFSNSLVPHVPSGLLPVSSLMPTSSASSPSSSSLFSSPSSSSSRFSNSSTHFSSPYLLPQSDTLPLSNGHCNTATLDVREALNSMLQAGPDRKTVIQYRHQD